MENLCRHLEGQFDALEKLIDLCPGADALALELQAIRVRFAITVAPIFCRAALGEVDRADARAEINRLIAAENFSDSLAALCNRAQCLRPPAAARGAAKKAPGAPPRPKNRQSKASPLLEKYRGHAVDCTAAAVRHSFETHGDAYSRCADCGREMVVCPETSELLCGGCGQVRELIGTVFDDSQFYHQEGQKSKSGSFNPNRHYHFWMERILARETAEELGAKDGEDPHGEKLLLRLREITERDQKILQLLTVEDIRSMLKELERTDLNKNVPQIMRRLTGVGPPPLSEEMCQRVEKLFSKAIEINERKRPASRSNRNYYPYYIYKILDAVLPPDDKSRGILYYIYMQGQETLDKNDKEWAEICTELSEISYVATSRTSAKKYRPKR